MATIHPTAVIAPGARLADNVDVGPFAVIADEVVIGAGCRIGPHAVIHPYVTLGAGCQVHGHVVLGDLPQDLAFKGGRSYVRVGQRCIFREGVTIHRGTKEDSETVVGDDCFLMANAHLGHNVRLGRKVIIANGALLAGYVEVGDGVFISGHAMAHQFIRLGRLVMFSGAAMATKDVAPFCLMYHAWMNKVAGFNIVGMRRAGFTAAQITLVKRVYQVIFREGLVLREALAEVRRLYPDPLTDEIVSFIGASKRGICRPPTSGHPEEEERQAE